MKVDIGAEALLPGGYLLYREHDAASEPDRRQSFLLSVESRGCAIFRVTLT